jgi:hypothetical protein
MEHLELKLMEVRSNALSFLFILAYRATKLFIFHLVRQLLATEILILKPSAWTTTFGFLIHDFVFNTEPKTNQVNLGYKHQP